VFRVRLDRDDLLLEFIMDVIERNDIQDGAVMTASGSLQEYAFHGVGNLADRPDQYYITKKEAMEILSVNGLIAAGENPTCT